MIKQCGKHARYNFAICNLNYVMVGLLILSVTNQIKRQYPRLETRVQSIQDFVKDILIKVTEVENSHPFLVAQILKLREYQGE